MKNKDTQLLEEAYTQEVSPHLLDNPEYLYLYRMLGTFYRQLKRSKTKEDATALKTRLEEIHKQMRDIEIEDMKQYEGDWKDLSSKSKVQKDGDVDTYNVGPSGYR